MRSVVCFIVVFLCCGCFQSNREMVPFHEDGRSKPAVAFPAIKVNVSNDGLLWDVGKEISDEVNEKFLKDGRVFVDSGRFSDIEGSNWFDVDVSFASVLYPKYQFAIFVDIVEHDGIPYLLSSTNRKVEVDSGYIFIKCRIRVIDLRNNAMKVILQENVIADEDIPRYYDVLNCKNYVEDYDKYKKTPIYKIHKKISKIIYERVGKYILMSTGIVF